MTEPISPTAEKPDTDEYRTGTSGTTLQTARSGAGQPPATRGRTTIAGGVVEKIAGLAAREVPGIHALGGGFARTIGAVRDRVPRGRAAAVSRGVKVEVGERQTAIDLDVVVEYGVSITAVAAEVRENVIAAVERMTGLEVVEVNISVDDVHLPDEGGAEAGEVRVQ
ncbi:Asp23/Gls24 family envelope stress response protein [Streptomyces sp. NPDC059070]|uniref:Asp23/Gls24 family envelope stress response protein n=1 Tax=unclassified Streptomyces TaxID=2593676 RepID=UPI0034E30358